MQIMNNPAKRRRRTQEERTTETRARLLDATLQELLEGGYGRTTTSSIADRAGVSRGALSHHYASKEELVVEAVEHLLQQATAEIRALAGDVTGGRLSLDEFLDRLWAMFSGRLFYITLEHVGEARHNPNLKASLIPVVREFHRALDEIWRGYFVAAGLSDAELENTLNATLCLLRGMGLQSVLRDDAAYFDRLLSWWKAELRLLLDPASKRKPANLTMV